jgi:XRE family transcriptional regulator, regulator of sulfur utilization
MEPVQPPSVGRNIQRIRKQQQLTLGVLGERSGVSKAMLSQIESEKVNPTVATVWKIARGLEVDLDALLKGTGAPVRKFLVTRRDEARTLEPAGEGLHIRVLSPLAMAEDLEIYLLTFEPGGTLRSQPHAPQTEEYVTVLDGRVRVSAGEKSVEMEAGEFIIYSCDIEHAIENLDPGTSRVQMIVRFARRHGS